MFDIRTHRPDLVNPAERAAISRLTLPNDLKRAVLDNLRQRGFPIVEEGDGFIRARATEEQWAEFGVNANITRTRETGTEIV